MVGRVAPAALAVALMATVWGASINRSALELGVLAGFLVGALIGATAGCVSSSSGADASSASGADRGEVVVTEEHRIRTVRGPVTMLNGKPIDVMGGTEVEQWKRR